MMKEVHVKDSILIIIKSPCSKMYGSVVVDGVVKSRIVLTWLYNFCNTINTGWSRTLACADPAGINCGLFEVLTP